MEGEGGRFRRTHLVPVPQVATLAELNARLEKYDRADDHRRIGNRVRRADELVEVLLLHRHMRAVDIVDGLTAALAVGAVRGDVVPSRPAGSRKPDRPTRNRWPNPTRPNGWSA